MSDLFLFNIYSIMVLLVNILGFLSLACILSLVFRESLVRVFPVCAAAFMLILYALAFVRMLSLIDCISLAFVALCLFMYRRAYRGSGLRELAGRLFSPASLTVYTMLALSLLVMGDMCLTNRDDLGCWAIEAGSIFYHGGFAPRYQNIAVSFGRYHPGATLWRWWLCHICGGFSEGRLMAASAWLFVLLLSPMLEAFRLRRILAPFAGLALGLFFLLLPGVFDHMPYLSICAEPLISAAFAGVWILLFSPRRGASLALFASYIFCMCFFKSTGIIFALALLIFLFIARKNPADIAGEDSALAGLSFKRLLSVSLLSALPTGLWYIYCALMERSNYFTVSLESGAAAANANTIYTRNLLSGIFTEAMHYARDGILDLPVIAVMALFVLLWLAARRLGYVSPAGAKTLGRYYLGLLLAFFIALLLMHCFVFQEELYFDRPSMIASCARYGEPLFLGAALFLFWLFASHGTGRTRLMFTGFFFAFAMLCTCLWTVYYRVIDNSAGIMQAQNFRQIVSERCEPFLSLADDGRAERILFLYGEDMLLQDLERTNLQFLSMPDSLVLCEVGGESSPADIGRLITELHPDSIYCTALDEDFVESLGIEGLEQNSLHPLK